MFFPDTFSFLILCMIPYFYILNSLYIGVYFLYLAICSTWKSKFVVCCFLWLSQWLAFCKCWLIFGEENPLQIIICGGYMTVNWRLFKQKILFCFLLMARETLLSKKIEISSTALFSWPQFENPNCVLPHGNCSFCVCALFKR